MARWRADSKELMFVNGDGAVVAVDVAPGAAFQARAPKKLFQMPLDLLSNQNVGTLADATRDAQRLLMVMPVQESAQRELAVVVELASRIAKVAAGLQTRRGDSMRSLLFILLFAVVLNLPLPAQQAPPAAPAAPAAPGLTITTVAWPDGDDIPVKYTQAVPNPVSPALTWTNVPAGTRSFVLHMHDPDVAINKTTATQVHWLVWGIPGTATGIE